MARFVVTESDGFLGHHLCESLLGRGHEIRGFLGGSNLEQGQVQDPDFAAITGPLTAQEDFGHILDDVDQILLLAVSTNGRSLAQGEAKRISAAERLLIEAAAERAIPVMSLKCREHVHLQEPHAGAWRYGTLADDTLKCLQELAAARGLCFWDLEVLGAYGPGGQHTLLGQLMDQVIHSSGPQSGQYLPGPKAAPNAASYLYIEDATAAILALIESGQGQGQSLRIAAGDLCTGDTLTRLVIDLDQGSGAEFNILNSGTAGAVELHDDNSQLMDANEEVFELTGWRPQTILRVGLRRTLEARRRELALGRPSPRVFETELNKNSPLVNS